MHLLLKMVINYSTLFSNNLSNDSFTSGNNLQKKVLVKCFRTQVVLKTLFMCQVEIFKPTAGKSLVPSRYLTSESIYKARYMMNRPCGTFSKTVETNVPESIEGRGASFTGFPFYILTPNQEWQAHCSVNWPN